jgi:DNA-binding IclR family transcriptional regulator
MAEQRLSQTQRREKYAVPALEKGLDVLEYLSQQAMPLTQAQMARALSRQPGELFRMLTCLEARGYLHRDAATGGYALTLKMFELSRTHSPYEALLNAARPIMRQLADATGESCHLSILQHGQVLVLAQEESPKPLRLSVQIGSVHSVFHTVSGRILMSALPKDARIEVLSENPSWKKMSAAERNAFLARLDELQLQGFDSQIGERFVGGADIGVLIGKPGSAINAALTVATLVSSGDDRPLVDLLPPLREHATMIGKEAGLGLPQPLRPPGS